MGRGTGCKPVEGLAAPFAPPPRCARFPSPSALRTGRTRSDGPMRGTTKKTVEKARRLRREMSRPEARLWPVLRTRPEGFKFRRQHPVGPYVLDFYRPGAKLAIEVDG